AALRPASPGQQRTRPQRPDAESLGWLHALRWQAQAPRASAAAAPAPSGPWLVVGDEAQDAASVVQALQARGESAQASPSATWTGALAGVRQLLWLLGEGEDEAAPYRPVQVLQALRQAGGTARLWFATRGAQAVVDGARV